MMCQRLILVLSATILFAVITEGKLCPHSDVECNDQATCCELPPGQGYGCCPFRSAVCCSDKTHCCPHGMTCDLKAGRCLRDPNHLTWITVRGTIGALTGETDLVKLDQVQPAAVAAGQTDAGAIRATKMTPDQVKPAVAAGQTDAGAIRATKMTPDSGDTNNRLLMLLLDRINRKKECPDKSYSCEPFQTCCQLNVGWGCCPLGPHAVCCSDKEHCCPAGTVCDPKTAACFPKP